MASFEDLLLVYIHGPDWVGKPNNAKTVEPETRICVKRQFDTDDESTDKRFMEAKKLCTTLNTINVERYHEIFLCHDIREQLNRLNREVQSFITRPEYLVPFLQPGRLIKVKKGNLTFDWGIVMDFEEISSKELFYLYPVKDKTVVIIDVLLHLSKDSEEGNPIPCREDEEGEMEVVPVLHSLVSQISLAKVPYLKSYFKHIYFKPCRKNTLEIIQLINGIFPNGNIPLLDPIRHMNIKDQACKDIVEKIEALEKRLCMHCKNYKYL